MGKQKHFFTFFMGSGMNMILSLITTPLITRLVAPEVYGNWSLFILFGNIYLIMATLGFDQGFGRFFYTHDEEEYKTHVLRVAAKLPLGISLATALILLAVYVTVGKKYFILPIFAVYMFAFVIERFTTLTLRLKMKSTAYAIIINIQKLTYTVLAVGAICLTNINHLAVLCGCTVISHLVTSFLAMRRERNMWSLKIFFGPIHKEYLDDCSERSMIKYSWPLIFSSLCYWVFLGADKVMIKMFSTATELGYYASATSILNVFAIVTTTFNLIWGPMALEQYEKGDGDHSFYVKATDYISIVMFGFVGTVVFAKDAIIYFLGSDYRAAVVLLPMLSLHPLMYSISESTVYGINFKKKTQYHLYFTAFCSVLNIMLNYILINKCGALGAAIATGITYTVFFILRTYFSMKCFPVKYNLYKIAIMTVLYYIFAIYNTTHFIDWVSCLMYAVLAGTGIYLYKDALRELIGFGLDYAKSILKKGKKKEAPAEEER